MPDLRNHGNSPHADPHTYAHMFADLKAFLQEHVGGSGGKATLVGHSMGGKLAMLTSILEPSLVDKLLIVDGDRIPPAL